MTLSEWRQGAAQRLIEHSADTIEARLDAEVLLGYVLGRSRTWLFAHADEPISVDDTQRLDELLEQRAQGVPIAYLTGHREFRSRNYRVTPAVLVPRDDTETLIDAALQAIQQHLAQKGQCCVIEPGTGSGIVATCLALETDSDDVRIIASDINADTLAVAQDNARRLNADVDFFLGNWLACIADQSVDVIASNPPYIATNDHHLKSLAQEPQLALVSGVDGLDAIRTLITDGTRTLTDNGVLLMEHGYDQAVSVGSLLSDNGYHDIEHFRDLAGHVRVTAGRMRR